MIRFFIETNEGELQALAPRMERFGRMLNDLTPFWPSVVTTVREVISQAFESEGASTHDGAWRALSPRYAAQKAVRFPGAPILVRTGALKASLLGGPGGEVVSTPHQLTFRSTVPYGGYHQRGDGPPKRAPWSPTERDVARVVATVNRAMSAEALRIFRPSQVGRFRQAMS